MRFKGLRGPAFAVAGAGCVVAGCLGFSAATALAAPLPVLTSGAVTSACPTVGAGGVVTPPPAPGVDWLACNLTGADLEDANLTAADLNATDLNSANLTGANLTDAVLASVNLFNANLTGVTASGALWADAICPNGANANYYTTADGCLGPVAVTTPSATPTVTGGTGGKVANDFWYTSAVTVSWYWIDANSLIASKCPGTTTSTGQGSAVEISATCTDSDGNVGTGSATVKIDTGRPVVTVIGVIPGHDYVIGSVPQAGCLTSASASGIETAASVSISTTGSHGIGGFTATCAGAVSVAGTPQAGPVRARYTVGYGFGGFIAPPAGSTLAKSARDITVRFRLVRAGDKAITAAAGKALAAARDIRMVLRGPGIRSASALCEWSSASHGSFSCALSTPAKVRTGRKNKYTITIEENVRTGFYAVPAVGRTANPEAVYFR